MVQENIGRSGVHSTAILRLKNWKQPKFQKQNNLDDNMNITIWKTIKIKWIIFHSCDNAYYIIISSQKEKVD
jgi:hypothetical protein